MKRPTLNRWLVAVVAAGLAHLPATASACAVCMGDPNTKTAGAINGAIFFMLGFVALMLGSLSAFAFHLMKRANAPVPPHVELAEMMTAQENSK